MHSAEVRVIRFSSGVFVVIAALGVGCSSSGGGGAEPGDGGVAEPGDGGASAATEAASCPRDFSGLYRVVSVTRDPDAGGTRCFQLIARLTVTGTDPMVFVQEAFEYAEDADLSGACPAHSDWIRGENLPECMPTTRSTVERVR